MRIAGAAIGKGRRGVSDGVGRLMDAIDGEDQAVETFAARGLHTLDLIDVIRGVTSVNRAERAGEICRDGVAIVVLQQAKR